MFQTFKVKSALVMTVLLLASGVLLSGQHQVAAQSSSPSPEATETCSAQDAAATVEAPEADSAVDTDNVEFQCGDQTAPDVNAETESNVESVEPANDKGGDNIDQQGDYQDIGDTQPDSAGSNQ